MIPEHQPRLILQEKKNSPSPTDVLGKNEHSPQIVAAQTGVILEAFYFQAFPNYSIAADYLRSHTLPYLTNAINAIHFDPTQTTIDHIKNNQETFNHAKITYGHMASRRIGSKFLIDDFGKNVVPLFPDPANDYEFADRFREIKRNVGKVIRAMETGKGITVRKNELFFLYEFFDAARDIHISQDRTEEYEAQKRTDVAKSILGNATISEQVLPKSVTDIEKLTPSRRVIAAREVERLTNVPSKTIEKDSHSILSDQDDTTIFVNDVLRGKRAKPDPEEKPKTKWREAEEEVITLLGLDPNAFDV